MDPRDNTRDEMDYISTWNSSIDIKLSLNLSTSVVFSDTECVIDIYKPLLTFVLQISKFDISGMTDAVRVLASCEYTMLHTCLWYFIWQNLIYTLNRKDLNLKGTFYFMIFVYV